MQPSIPLALVSRANHVSKSSCDATSTGVVPFSASTALRFWDYDYNYGLMPYSDAMLHVGAYVSISSQLSGNNGFNHDPSREGAWYASSCPPASIHFRQLCFTRLQPLGNLHVNFRSRCHKQFPLLPAPNPSIEYTIHHLSYNHRPII